MEPEQRVADFIKAGSDIVSVHAEQSATIHLHRLVNNVRNPARHMQLLQHHGPVSVNPHQVLTGSSPDLPEPRILCLLALCADQGPWSKGRSCAEPWNIPHSHRGGDHHISKPLVSHATWGML